MHDIETSTRIRVASPLLLSILLVMFALVFVLPGRALAQDGSGNDKVEAISKRLEQLEKEMEALNRENEELKKKFEEKGIPKETLAEAKETPAANGPVVAAAQDENKPQKKEKSFEIGGQIRLRPELKENGVRLFEDTSNFYVRQRIRLHVKAKLSEDLTGFVELQDGRVWGAEFSTLRNIANVDLHQTYIQVDNVLTRSLSLKVGRQELSYGDERLVGAFDWDNVGRSFDGVKAVYAKDSWSADLFAARVNESGGGLIFVPGDDFFFAAKEDFYGAYLKLFNDNPNHKLEFYGLFLRDGTLTRGELRRTFESTMIYTIGSRQELNFGGGFHYDGEMVFQTGNVGPDGHKAYALAARLDKRFKAARSPHLGFEYDFASGDGNFRDGRSREFVNLFPNNHIHYGYIDYLGWRNMHDFKLSFGFNPASRLAFDADYHNFFLHKGDGRWSDADGFTLAFDPSGTFGKKIGQELDLTLRFPYKEHINFLAGYSVFRKGRFAEFATGIDFSPRFSHFSYVQALISF